MDVSTTDILAKAEEVGADIVGLSALLTTTMVKQKEVIDEITKRGMKVKVMVGGAPVTKEWVHKIEADGYSEDAIGAVNVAKELMGVIVINHEGTKTQSHKVFKLLCLRDFASLW